MNTVGIDMEKFSKAALLTLLGVICFIASNVYAVRTTTYIHSDASGSVIAASDENGALVWRKTYMPYGKQLTSPNRTRELAYTGKHFDADLGLSFYGARWYDPSIGRFTAIDPAGFNDENPQSFNRYAYANNNPYRYVDPDGESPFDIAFLVIDTARLGLAIYSGNPVAIQAAAIDVAASAIGVLSPVPGTGQALKAIKVTKKVADVARKSKSVSRVAKSVTKEASKEITKSSRKRVKRLVKDLSDNSRQNNGLSQEKTDQLRRIVEKAGGKLRNDGVSGVKGSSAGKPHVQTEGLGKSIDSRHIWTKEGVQ